MGPTLEFINGQHKKGSPPLETTSLDHTVHDDKKNKIQIMLCFNQSNNKSLNQIMYPYFLDGLTVLVEKYLHVSQGLISRT